MYTPWPHIRLMFPVWAHIFTGMTQVAASRRNSTLGRYTPRRFNPVTRERFIRDRRFRYLAQLPDPPSDREASRIEAMVRLEWSACKAEADGSLTALREAREFRRLLERLRDDWERALTKPVGAAAQRAELSAYNERRVLAARGGE
jgi:hypothetical protein